MSEGLCRNFTFSNAGRSHLLSKELCYLPRVSAVLLPVSWERCALIEARGWATRSSGPQAQRSSGAAGNYQATTDLHGLILGQTTTSKYPALFPVHEEEARHVRWLASGVRP